MGLTQEFKDFAMKGNVVDLAVGVIIGGAFGKIISAMVDKILMPIIGLLMGGVDFSNLKITVGEASVGYGFFIQTVVDFLIVAFCLFIVIKAMNKTKKPAQPAVAPPTSEEILLLRQIRDSLNK